MHYCLRPGCPNKVESGYCKACKPHARAADLRLSASRRGYDRHWRRFRTWYLAQNPLCVECRQGSPCADRCAVGGYGNFRFHDLRHTFASWYMMNGGDLYALAKILGHANIKMTERYAKLAKQHIARTGNTAREMWRMMEKREGEGSERVG